MLANDNLSAPKTVSMIEKESTVLPNELTLTHFHQWLDQAVLSKKIAAVDKQLVNFLLKNVPENIEHKEKIGLGLFLCHLSVKMTKGNVCCLLKKKLTDCIDESFYGFLPQNFQALIENMPVSSIIESLVTANLAIKNENDLDWLKKLETLTQIPPIILIADRAYFQRMWHDEYTVAKFFTDERNTKEPNLPLIKKILNDNIFNSPKESPDRQKVASVISLLKPVSIISGGPGTGKTTTVAAILLAAIRLNPTKKPLILLAAPTGKAAARLTESLISARNKIEMTDDEKESLSLEALTLHRLLGASHLGDGFIHNKNNPLNGDFLVIDEASMIDLRLMAKLIEAIPSKMKVILLGDRDQLSSVAPGRVLGDLCYFGGLHFSKELAVILSEMLGNPITDFYQDEVLLEKMADMIGFLTFSRRFEVDSTIGHLAKAINQKDTGRVKKILAENQHNLSQEIETHEIETSKLITSTELKSTEATSKNSFYYINTDVKDSQGLVRVYEKLLNDCLLGFTPYIEEAKQLCLSFNKETNALSCSNEKKPSISSVLEKFNLFRVLCAIHHGTYGTVRLNQAIRERLYQEKLLDSIKEKHYFARPVLITRNDKMLGLFNGDIGITLTDPQTGFLKVYFKNPQGKIVAVSPARLPLHETAFAMTVHKSQGSEFNHTLLVMPTEINPVLTKELIYTGVTRAKDTLSLYATLSTVLHSVNHQTPRSSGLVEQIKALSVLND